jgi:hypothetical protein
MGPPAVGTREDVAAGIALRIEWRVHRRIEMHTW